MMESNPIPPDVLSFIDRFVTSIDQLEILILLKQNPDRTWSAVQVSSELRSNPDAADQRLHSLQRAGLVAAVSEPEGTYQYRPGSPATDAVIAKLVQCYRDYRLRVIERVFKKPDSLQSFADAFRIKKDRS